MTGLEVLQAHRWTTEGFTDGSHEPPTCTCGSWGGTYDRHPGHVAEKLAEARQERGEVVVPAARIADRAAAEQSPGGVG